MPCLACATRPVSDRGLCTACRSGFVPGGERRLPGGVLVRSAFAHGGAARLLVHRLKYAAQPAAARLLAAAMAPGVPPDAAALVPVPRARARRWRYGVDPAAELARCLGRALGLPVVAALVPAWWHRRRAGPAGARRGVPRFRCVRQAPAAAVLVDDVVTTGATLRAAAAALGGPRAAVTATAALASGAARPVAAAGVIVGREAPEGDVDDGRVRAAGSARLPGSLSHPACPPALRRARATHRRSRWRFTFAVSA